MAMKVNADFSETTGGRNPVTGRAYGADGNWTAYGLYDDEIEFLENGFVRLVRDGYVGEGYTSTLAALAHFAARVYPGRIEFVGSDGEIVARGYYSQDEDDR